MLSKIAVVPLAAVGGTCLLMAGVFVLLASPVQCGGPDYSVLRPGDRAVVSGESGAELEGRGHLAPGVVVRVGHDSGDPNQDRPIKVTVETGDRIGESGSVKRRFLRPIE